MDLHLWLIFLLLAYSHQSWARKATTFTEAITNRSDDAINLDSWRRALAHPMDVLPPPAVRKMSDDPGEMFFLNYWQYKFTDEDQETNTTSQALPPFLPLLDCSRWALASRLFKRGFQCPTGTSSCTSINQPDSCCSTGETCIVIQDTGLGPVGCCPDGQTCGGTVASCNTAQGYTSCPGSPNGGCCIPGYVCQGVGCVLASTTTITPSSSATTPSSTAVNSPATSAQPTVSIFTSIITISASASQVTTTTTVIISPTAVVVSTASIVPPVRPTDDSSVSSASTTAINTASTTSVAAACPTNFYRCSAYYQGGCCRVGRDCSSTSCPAASSSTVTNDPGATVVLVTGGGCANGWQSCAASVGGGCCPQGYACGTASCSASAAGASNVGKISSGATVTRPREAAVALILLLIALYEH